MNIEKLIQNMKMNQEYEVLNYEHRKVMNIQKWIKNIKKLRIFVNGFYYHNDFPIFVVRFMQNDRFNIFESSIHIEKNINIKESFMNIENSSLFFNICNAFSILIIHSLNIHSSFYLLLLFSKLIITLNYEYWTINCFLFDCLCYPRISICLLKMIYLMLLS